MDGATSSASSSRSSAASGYRVEHTGRRGDFGADLLVSKQGRKIPVQAKRYSKPVGIRAVQEAVAAKGFYGCGDALVVGTVSSVLRKTWTPSSTKDRRREREAVERDGADLRVILGWLGRHRLIVRANSRLTCGSPALGLDDDRIQHRALSEALEERVRRG
jgi:Restriction endonuclease